MENSNGIMPVMNVGNGDGFMNGNCGWLWIIFLFFLMAWGGGGMFGNGYRDGQISNDFLYTNLKNTMDTGFTQNANQNFQIQKDIAQQSLMNQQGFCGVMQDINASTFGLQNDIMQNRFLTQNQLAENRFASQQCCCETNRNIDSVKYEMAQNTCAITSTDNANTQKILDKLCTMESNAKDAHIAQLQMDLQAAQLTLGNSVQTQNIINALTPPRPIPAYVVNPSFAGGFAGGLIGGFAGAGIANNNMMGCPGSYYGNQA